MSKWPEDFQKYVLDDVKEYPLKNKPVKASLLERLAVKKLSTLKLHANPADEFSWDSVGPNFTIIGNYEESIRKNMGYGMPLYEEPIIVEKMSPEGYMITNGHHRWFACLHMKVPKVLVKIVNQTHAEDIIRALAKTQNHKSAAFDLDEVLLVNGKEIAEERPVHKLGRRAIKERLRLGTIETIGALKANGYDIWVYTAGYNSEKYIAALFKLYGLEVEGIINGFGRKKDKGAEEVKSLFAEKYKQRIHIDNENVFYSDTETQGLEQYDLEHGSDNWGKDIVDVLARIKQ